VLKKRYTPDIAELGATCEANYLRLSKLRPAELDSVDTLHYELFAEGHYLGVIKLSLTERSRYTDTILLEQTHAAGRWLNDPHMLVRIYHDASMAEVISAQGHLRIDGFNDYPNDNMHLPDEKSQLNKFLAEWLSICLRYGHRKNSLDDQANVWCS
tara:strand:+ start:8408 stop:8875 length:468 start_codon:yes stop_codon:yes gene_type:complete